MVLILSITSFSLIESAFAQTSTNWNQVSYRIGDWATVTIEDPLKNLDSAIMDVFYININSDSDSQGMQLLMVETSSNSGVFRGTILFSSSTYSELGFHVEEGDQIYANYDGFSAQATIVSSFSLISPITVSTDKTSYRLNEVITVSGKVDQISEGIPLTLRIISPEGHIASSAELEVNSDKRFSTEIQSGGALWEKSGNYLVSVIYGSEKRKAEAIFSLSTSYDPGITGNSIKVQGTQSFLEYSIKGGDLVLARADFESHAIRFSIDTQLGGKLTIVFPREFIDAKDTGGADIDFVVLENENKNDYFERITTLDRTLTIPFTPKVITVEVIGTELADITTPSFPVSSPSYTDIIITPGSSVLGCEIENKCYIPYKKIIKPGETITWFNQDSAAHTVTSGNPEQGHNEKFDSGIIFEGKSFSHSFLETGIHEYYCLYHPWQTGIIEVEELAGGDDEVPPLLLVPENMVIASPDNGPVMLDYNVRAIDNIEGVVNPRCSPPSGTFFYPGKTTVSCSISDSAGNSVENSFVVTVTTSTVEIPSWIKDVAGFWCNNEIDDYSFVESVQYLIDNNVIIITVDLQESQPNEEIPTWIKGNACWWAEGLISDKDFASGLQYLIEHSIIQIGEKNRPID